MMNPELLKNCSAAAFAGTMTFGETIGHMIEDEVEWYSANLILGCQTLYDQACATVRVDWPSWATPAIADEFDEAEVVAAIRAIQQRQIIFPEFLHRIAAAGVTYYTVHLGGRKAIYFGRHGNFYIEPFPQT